MLFLCPIPFHNYWTDRAWTAPFPVPFSRQIERPLVGLLNFPIVEHDTSAITRHDAILVTKQDLEIVMRSSPGLKEDECRTQRRCAQPAYLERGGAASAK